MDKPVSLAPGSSRALNSRGITAIAIAVALLAGLVGGAVWLAIRNAESLRAAARTQDVRSLIADVLLKVEDAETGQRGYLLTGLDSYLQPYTLAVGELPGLMAVLQRSVSADTSSSAEYAELRRSIDAKLAELRQTIGLYRAGDAAGALTTVRTNRGRDLMDNIRQQAGVLAQEQGAELARQVSTVRRDSNLQVVVDLVGILFILGTTAIAAAGLRRTLLALHAAEDASRQANAALEAANATLEARVAQRTADLQQANEEVQRFAYIVSHDLRSPLVNIMGFTSELEAATAALQKVATGPDAPADARTAAQEDLPEAIRFIKTSTAKMDRLINAILGLSREGRRVLKPEQLDMTRVMQSIADSFEHQVQEREADIQIDPLPELIGDRLLIEQIFSNVIENALKYSYPGRPGRVLITGERTGTAVRFRVADNGRGIAQSDLERVFELFRRAGDQTVPGEGIGLAHVRAAVRRVGGSISVESTFGAGSVFHVVLPAVITKDRVAEDLETVR